MNGWFVIVQFCDYHTVAEGYGGIGLLVDRSNEAQIEDVFRQAQLEASQGRSVLVNCLIGKTSFRDGSISVWTKSVEIIVINILTVDAFYITDMANIPAVI